MSEGFVVPLMELVKQRVRVISFPTRIDVFYEQNILSILEKKHRFEIKYKNI